MGKNRKVEYKKDKEGNQNIEPKAQPSAKPQPSVKPQASVKPRAPEKPQSSVKDQASRKPQAPERQKNPVVDSKPGKRERALMMIVRIFSAIIRFFENRVKAARERRLSEMMDNK